VFLHLYRKEILDTIGSSRFMLVFLMCCALVILSLFIGAADQNRAQKEHDTSVAQMAETAKQQVSYQALGMWGMFKVYRPPSPLFVFARGVEEASGNNSVVSIFQEPKLQDSRFSVDPIHAQLSTLDFVFVVKVIVALLALMLTFDLINGEQERGTLKLVLSNPVPRTTLILAKIAGAWSALVVPLLIPALIGVLGILVAGGVEWGADHWMRIITMVFATVLYVSVFVSFGVFVSCIVSRPSNAFLVLVLIWLAVVWVMPGVALYAATEISDVAAAYEIDRKKGEIDREWYRESAAQQAEWLRRNPGHDSVPVDVQGEINGDLQKEAQKKKSRIDEAHAADVSYRDSLVMRISRVSPAAAFDNIMLGLAMTGVDRQQAFLSEVKEFRNAFQRYVGQKMMQERKYQLDGGAVSYHSGLDLSGMPRITFEDAPFGRDVSALWPDFAVLILLLFLFTFGSVWAFLHYDVH
jgi:ABC-type transport system involved in multi-copper enzyme maturation permease subunit